MMSGWSIVLTALFVGQPADAPRFEVRNTAGVVENGPIHGIDDGFAVQIADKSIPGDKLVSLHRVGVVIPSAPLTPSVLLTSGDHLRLDPEGVLRLEEETLRFDLPKSIAPPKAGPISIRATAVSMLWFAPPEQADRPEELQHRVEHGLRKLDVVGLREGDRIEGSLLSLSASGGQIKAGTRRMDVPLKQLSYVAFNTQWQSKPRLKRPYGHVTLEDGARLTLASMQWKGNDALVTGKTLWGAEVQFPIRRLVALHIKQGAATYLSDLEASVQSDGFVGVAWPLGRNALPRGGPLLLKGETVDFGLAAHARTSATYKLDGSFRTFEAWLGMPAGSDPRARVRFRVLKDGKPAAGIPDREWTANDPPAWVRIDVAGSRELTLIADFGSFGDIAARAIWGYARLLRD
ncbi:MAG: NPCBM/NEW2 domain-containing protein [Gemmataceae bacterium]|nr:NPCBM/NEW2 domain-containing protein [Gemmataceae bacterium]